MLLSICIPTYNRCDKVLSLLRFVMEEVKPASDIEVIVSDNCSTDNTQTVLNEYVQDKEMIHYSRNSDNLGLIGNLHRLVELAHGQYVWFMGDDDIYYQGVIGQVISKLKGGAYSYLFINHCAYKDNPSDGTGFSSAIPESLSCEETQKAMLKIFNHSGTSLMFISASVFNRDILANCDCSGYDNLALPLYWSFYCASKGNMGLVPDVLIANKWGEISWSNESKRIFSEYIPNIFDSLPHLGYSRFASKLSLLKLKYRRSAFYGYSKAVLNKLK